MQLDIVMPYWGDISLFKRAVESVLAQTDKNWRLFIVENAMESDEPSKWIASLRDDRISYVRNSRNIGLAANFQKSLTFADAEYVTIFGSDDLLLPNYVDRIKSVALKYGPDFIQPGTNIIDENDESYLPVADRVKNFLSPSINSPTALGGEELVTSLCHGNWLYFPGIAWKTSVVKKIGFQTKFQTVLDLALVFDVLLGGGIAVFDPVPSFSYRRHKRSASSESAIDGERFKEESDLMRTYSSQFKSVGWSKAARAARLRLSSRLHALLAIPKAISRRNSRKSLSTLIKHTVQP